MPKSVNLSKAHAIHAIQVYHALKVTVSSDISISRIGEQCLIYGIHFTVGKKKPKTQAKICIRKNQNWKLRKPPIQTIYSLFKDRRILNCVMWHACFNE